jgi:fibro-slime domain-containing protein
MRDAGPKKPLDASRPPIITTPRADAGSCDNALVITVRDFTESHPDFEKSFSPLKGVLEGELGPDKKPVYASPGPTAASSGPDAFGEWYNDVDGVNQRLSYRVQFTEKAQGVFVYDSSAFFPIDGMGFGNGPDTGGVTIPGIGTIGGSTAEHNFLFTTEAHTVFSYRGGEKFSFTGDDDMWVFLNNRLAIDLGGTHSELSASIDLDAEAQRLGLVKGNTYPMDIFHAERHTDESNYHIETTIDLSCIENIPVF